MTTPGSPVGRAALRRRFTPRNWNLRVKLAVVLLVPGLLALVLVGLRIADQTDQLVDRGRAAGFASAQVEVTTLVEKMGQERLAAGAFVGADRPDRNALQAAFNDVDVARQKTEALLDDRLADEPALAGPKLQAEQTLARLPQLRDLVLVSNAPAPAVVERYSQLIDQLLQLHASLLREVNSVELSGLADGLAALATARNEASLQLALATSAGAGPPEVGLTGLPASDARLTTALAEFRAVLDAGQRVRYGSLIAGTASGDRDRLVQGLLARDGTDPLDAATVDEANRVYGTLLDEMDFAAAGMRDELAAVNAASQQHTVDLAGINAVLLLLALLIGGTLVGLIASGMISSLRTLRTSAMDIADNRLPDAVQRMRGGSVPDVNVEPVPVDTTEEVGEVARAFDAVHAQAVRLAAEQATLQSNVNSMFVNMSRRSQSLVDRQLQLIEELESNEQDAERLSHLFRLDHLATRMRRNSENLLVLAGTDPAKRTAQQVPAVDVLQAAVSEVDQYERVVVEQPPAVAVLGRAANDLQHLLSELLDNATSFSPPDTRVRMTTTRDAKGPLVVEIADRGVGMRTEELDEVNLRFARPDEVGVTASRRMGLFVVGRLAARHGVQVRLAAGAVPPAEPRNGSADAADAPGLTARVTIPAHLVVSGSSVAARGSAAAATAAATAAAAAAAAADPARPGPVGEPTIVVPRQRVSGDGPGTAPGARGRAGSDERAPTPLRPRRPAAERPAGAEGPAADRSVGPERPAVVGPPVPPPTGSTARPVKSGEDRPAINGTRPGAGARPGRNGVPGPPAPPAAQPTAPPAAPAVAPTTAAPSAAPPTAPPTAPPGPARPTIAAPELFAPMTPSMAADESAMGRTPIFEEVASGWFKAYRQVPINWQPDANGHVVDRSDGAAPAPPADPTPGTRPVRDAAPVPSTPTSPPTPPPTSPPTPPPTSPPAPPFRPSVVPARPSPAPAESEFAGPADDGWRAAVETRREVGAGTVEGTDLPRRTPGARLVPGGIAATGAPGGKPARDAEAIRSRLNNYQRGVRSGRGERDRVERDASGEPQAEVSDDRSR